MKELPPIFIISRFRSGSSFLWNLFRQDAQYRCYYEPLHDNLVEAVETNLAVMESHRGITSYWDEYQSLRKDLAAIHEPRFGINDLFLRPSDQRPEIAGLIRHLIRTAEREGRTCVIKCNRMDFRLAWLRENFPEARMISVERNPRDQWISSVRPHKPELWDRLEENRGYDLPVWIANLAPAWPFLLTGPARPAYYYSYLIWKLSSLFGRRFAQYQVDFDREIAAEPELFQQKMAAFFPADFFARPSIKAIFLPPLPGIWRRFRTEEWFRELEAEAEKTLRRAGIYRPAFWKWSTSSRPASQPPEVRRAVDLALLTFSRHRSELLVHSHQLQVSLEKATQYAESLRTEFDKSSHALKAVEGEQKAAEYKLRLLQAVYDSLKQAHDISIGSLTKTLEEFQYATKELRQIIAYKDAQLLQLAGDTPEAQKSLTDISPQGRLAGLAEQLDEARKIEQNLRQELENSRIGLVKIESASKAELAETRSTLDLLRSELTAVKAEVLEGKALKKHAVALEVSSAETWTALIASRKQLAASEAQRSQIEARLQARQAELSALIENERAMNQNLLVAKDREIALLHSQIAQESSGRKSLTNELLETRAALSAANDELGSHQAFNAHLRALEHASQEGWGLVVDLRRQMGELAATCEALKREHALRLESRERQLGEASEHVHKLELQISHLGNELGDRLAALDASESRGRQLTEELAEVRQRIGMLETSAGIEARLLTELQTQLRSAEEKHESLTQQNANLSLELHAEQAARTTEKMAYDQRTTLHIARLKDAHQMLDSAKSQSAALESDLQSQIVALSEQLFAANARLTAIEQSWARGLIHRLAPAAFTPNRPA